MTEVYVIQRIYEDSAGKSHFTPQMAYATLDKAQAEWPEAEYLSDDVDWNEMIATREFFIEGMALN